MRHFDLTPLYRTTVGFDRLAQLVDSVAGGDGETPFPPYNIERLSENEYRITMAVAGFGEGDLNIEVKENALLVRGHKAAGAEDEAQKYLHRGIAARNFERRFQLADFVEVSTADLKDGLLHIDLVRNLPERMKPRNVPIGQAPETPKQIEA